MATYCKALSVNFLNQDRQIVTRHQERCIRSIFPFLDLPAELRNDVYQLSIDLTGVEEYFDKYYERLRDTTNPRIVRPPPRTMKAPTIFLLNRQIYAEAVTLLPPKSLSFHHGLLDIKDTTQLVSGLVLRQLSSITVTTKGHPMLQSNILQESWSGYKYLLTELSDILQHGHHLKQFAIHLDDPDLVLHLTQCWEANNHCDFRDHIVEAFDKLRKIRGVGKVTITGLPPAFTTEIRTRMESKPVTFLELPGEVRNSIYSYAADYADIGVQLRCSLDNWINPDFSPPYPQLSTPTILLLNRQIHKEASSILRAKPFELVFPRHSMQKQSEVPGVLNFISSTTLQKVEHLNIKMEHGWEWIYSLDRMLAALAAKHSLKSLTFHFIDGLKSAFMAAQDKNYPDDTLHLSLSAFASIRGVASVSFSGDLPDIYVQPLKQIMESAVTNSTVPTLLAVRGDGTTHVAGE